MAFLNKTGVERLWLHVVSRLGKKVDKVDGKDLSTNDYTTEEKEQLATLGTLVGDTAVATQINNAVSNITLDSLGALDKEDYYGLIEKEGAVVSAKSLDGTGIKATSYISAMQAGEGDPSPDNIRPIIGWNAANLFRTGKNMLGFKDYLVNGSSFDESCESGVFHRTVTAAHATSYLTSGTGMQYIENSHIPAGTYTFTLTHLNGVSLYSPYLEVTLADGSTVQLPNGKATTIAQGGTITGVRMASKEFSTGDEFSYTLQLETGAGTEYEAYDGVVLSADLPETVYGGSLDWTTGLLTVTHEVIVFIGNEGFVRYTGGMQMRTHGVFMLSVKKTALGYGLSKCSHFVNATDVFGATGKEGQFSDHNTATYKYFGWGTVDSSTDEFTAWIAAQYAAGTPVTLVYKLATPYTIQLDPQQLTAINGVNHVWSNCGDTRALFNYSLCGGGSTNIFSDPIEARENLLITVSATQPASPTAGMIWLDIS